jgi:hypothetical protein
MTMRRIDRKRLYEVEKLGQNVDVSPSTAMKNALISATQHREGHKLITDMVFDFGATGAGLKTKALGVGDVVGTSAASHLCTITDSVFGVVTQIETIVLESISDGTLVDYDLMLAGDGVLDGHASSGNDGVLGANATGEVLIKADISADNGKHTLTAYNAEDLKNKFLYLTAGAATGQKASAVIDCTNATVGNLADGVDTIRLINSDGSTGVLFVAEDDTIFSGAAQANKFNIDSLGTPANLATSLKLAIDNNAAFTAVITESTKVTVTHAASTATSNHQAGYLLNDDPQAPNGIVIGEFTGGIDDGVAISSGKMMIRVTGFVAPADL